MDNFNFVRDCLDKKMSLYDIARRYNMEVDEVFDRYIEAKKVYTKEQIEQIMKEVYYCD